MRLNSGRTRVAARYSGVIGALLATMLVGAQRPALAADLGDNKARCHCDEPIKGTATALITAIKNSVSKIDDAGFSPASKGDTLDIGARLLTDATSQADFRVGERCYLRLLPNKEAEIAAEKGRYCVYIRDAGDLATSLGDTAEFADAAGGGASLPPSAFEAIFPLPAAGAALSLVLLGGGVAGGIGLATNGGNSISP